MPGHPERQILKRHTVVMSVVKFLTLYANGTPIDGPTIQNIANRGNLPMKRPLRFVNAYQLNHHGQPKQTMKR